jgi:3-methyladenine DNA glycosylase AlkD
MLTVEILDIHVEMLGPADADVIERFLRSAATWALVDGLSASVMGNLVERYAELGAVLDRWAVDDDFWIRRAALLALLVPLRRGRGDFDRFSRYADSMLEEREFFIRKAIGWVLRDTARKRPELVYEWLLATVGDQACEHATSSEPNQSSRAARASGVTIREAVKPLSEAQRIAVIAAASVRGG